MFFSSGSERGEMAVGKLPLPLSFNSHGTSINTDIFGMKIMKGILSFCLPRGEYTFSVSSNSKSFKPDPARGIVFVNTS